MRVDYWEKWKNQNKEIWKILDKIKIIRENVVLNLQSEDLRDQVIIQNSS